jgi:hypothetical protein
LRRTSAIPSATAMVTRSFMAILSPDLVAPDASPALHVRQCCVAVAGV